MKSSLRLTAFVCGAAVLILLWRQSPVLRAHAEINQLTPTDRATVAATRSGNWSDAGIWDGGPPQRYARIWIPEGITVTVDRELAEVYEWVRVDGVLRFAPDTSTALNLETLAIEHTGRLEIGTDAAPVTARAVLTFQHRGGEIDHVYDPIELSRGLVSVGKVEMHGLPKTSWVNVSQAPQAGTAWLELGRVPADWAPGDAVVLTAPSYGDDETFQILSIDETAIRLDRAIGKARAFPTNPKTGQPYAGLSLHLANLSRNVVVRTHPDHAGQARLQGHVMMMHRGGHSIKYVAFENLGRTTIDPVTDPLVGAGGARDPSLCPPAIKAENVRGRYGLHFHMATPFSEQSVVEGSSLVVRRGSRLKIGYINHSSNVVFKDNVGLNIDGSTFFTEEGDEVGAFIHNLAIYSVGSDTTTDEQPRDVELKQNCPQVFERRRLDVGHKGHGYWIHGGGVLVAENVAAEHAASGFNIWSRPLDHRLSNTFTVEFPISLLPGGGSWAGSGTMLDIESVPFVFRNNTSYVLGHAKNAGVGAFEVNYHSLHQATRFPNSPKNIFTGSLGWNARRGIATSYAGWVVYEQIRLLRGDLAGFQGSRTDTTGMGLARQGGNHNVLRDIVIDGFKIAIGPSAETSYQNVVVDETPYVPPIGEPTSPGR
jgi:G8 domain